MAEDPNPSNNPDDPSRLVAWAREVDGLHSRYFTKPPSTQATSRLDRDDVLLRPYHMSHEVTQRLGVAVDSLHGLRSMTVTPDGSEVVLRTYSPYPLLRAALENACIVGWLLDPVDDLERIKRRFYLQARSDASRDEVERLMKVHTRESRLPNEPTGRSRDREWLDRMRDIGVPDVDKVLKSPLRATPSTKAMVDAGATALASGRRNGPQAHLLQLGWRALSGASHGDLWALMALPEREIVGDPDPVTDRVGTEVSMTASSMVLWSWLATEAVKNAVTIFDHQRLAFREHVSDRAPRAGQELSPG